MGGWPGVGKGRSCYFMRVSGEQRPSKGERTRGAILARAVEEATRIGLGGLTIGTLASATGLSKSGLYAHFGSKESLQIAVLEAAGAEFSDAVIAPALRTPRGLERLRTLVTLWLTCGRRRHPGGSLLVKAGAELDDQPGPVREHLRDMHARLADSLERIVAGAVATGELGAATDSARFAADLYAVMLGYHHAHRLLENPRAEDRALAAVEALITAAAGTTTADTSPSDKHAGTTTAHPAQPDTMTSPGTPGGPPSGTLARPSSPATRRRTP